MLIKATNPSTTFDLFVSKVSIHTMEMCKNCQLEADGAMQLLGHGMALPRSTSKNPRTLVISPCPEKKPVYAPSQPSHPTLGGSAAPGR